MKEFNLSREMVDVFTMGEAETLVAVPPAADLPEVKRSFFQQPSIPYTKEELSQHCGTQANMGNQFSKVYSEVIVQVLLGVGGGS